MQLPIATLNYVHQLEYHFGLEEMFSYHLTEKQLQGTKIKTNVLEVKALLHIPTHSLWQEEEQVEFVEENKK